MGDLPIAARLNSKESRKLLRQGWNATKAEFERNLQYVRAGFADLSDEQIMADINFVRHHCANLGAYAGPPIHLYDEFGNEIRTSKDFIWACGDLDEPWIVPTDVHF